MGAQIAAHLANAGLHVYLLDIAPEDDGNANAVVERGFEAAQKARPDPFVDDAAKQRIMQALKDFETHLAQRTQRLVDSYETSVRRYQITSWVVLVLAALGITLVVGQTVARISRSVGG